MSTQLQISDSWGIQGLGLSLSETSTAAAVAQQSGTIFSRRQISSLLDAVESALDIHIQGLPVWLQEIQLTRQAVILGAHMRRIKVPQIMDELDMFKLSGLATLVVLCCRYSENEESLRMILDSLIVGELGTVVKIDRDCHPTIPYTFKGHLKRFVASCLDADRDTDISRLVTKWMAELQTFGDLRWTPKEMFTRSRWAHVQLLQELLGAPGHEDRMRSVNPSAETGSGWLRVHDTLRLSCAHIALAAAAHGASVVVECVLENGSRMIPKEPDLQDRGSFFLVRLWLTQPPEHIHGVLRHTEHTTGSSTPGADAARETLTEEFTVVGGTLEIAMSIARKLNLGDKLAEKGGTEKLLALWRSGVEYGQTLYWETVTRDRKDRNLRMVLRGYSNTPDMPSEAVELSRCVLAVARRAGPLARAIAIVISKFYGMHDFPDHLGDREGGLLDSRGPSRVIRFVMTAISVEILRKAIHPASDSTDSYALNLAAVDAGSAEGPPKLGLLCDLLVAALSEAEGVNLDALIFGISVVWGGGPAANFSLQAQPQDSDLLAFVAPRCVVMYDMIRDPLALIEQGGAGYLVSIWRGAVPMLPRDPVTNKTYSSASDNNWVRSWVGLDYSPKADQQMNGSMGPMLVTFESCQREPSRGIFCYWHGGHLVGEAPPRDILWAALSGSEPNEGHKMEMSMMDHKYRHPYHQDRVLRLTKMELLELAGFTISTHVSVVIEDLGDASWGMFALACVAHMYKSGSYLGIIRKRDHSTFENKYPGGITTGYSLGAVYLLLP